MNPEIPSAMTRSRAQARQSFARLGGRIVQEFAIKVNLGSPDIV